MRSRLAPTSEHRIREYAGDPADVARAVPGHDIVVVHGAPVTAEVLDAADLRLVCCARGGPVNVDVAAATAARHPGREHAGQERRGGRRADDRVPAHADQRGAAGQPPSHRRRPARRLDIRGREFFGREAPSITLGLVGLGHVGREVARRGQARARLHGDPAHDPIAARRPCRPASSLVASTSCWPSPIIVSLHARATAENRHLFGAKEFARMRPGAASSIPRASRSSTSRRSPRPLAAATSPAPRSTSSSRPAGGARHPLLDLPDVFVTPHIGGATEETLARGARPGGRRHRRDAGRAPARGRGQPRGLRPAGARRAAMSGSYLLAIDAGTGSCRALLFARKAATRGQPS